MPASARAPASPTCSTASARSTVSARAVAAAASTGPTPQTSPSRPHSSPTVAATTRTRRLSPGGLTPPILRPPRRRAPRRRCGAARRAPPHQPPTSRLGGDDPDLAADLAALVLRGVHVHVRVAALHRVLGSRRDLQRPCLSVPARPAQRNEHRPGDAPLAHVHVRGHGLARQVAEREL